MKLLFISNAYPPYAVGGYEQVCHDIAQGLSARGHQLCVLTSDLQAGHSVEQDPGVYRILQMAPEARASLGGSRSLPWPSIVSLDIRNTRALQRTIAAFQPDAVLVWKAAGFGLGLLALVQEMAPVAYYLQDCWLAPLLTGFTGRKSAKSLRRRVRRMELRMVGAHSDTVSSDNLIFVSRSLQEQYTKLGIETLHPTIIHNGISHHMFGLQPQHIAQRRPDEPFRILYCGRIVPEKGVSTVLLALAKVRSMSGLEQTALSLVGPFESTAYCVRLQNLVTELALDSAVRFEGKLQRTELPRIYGKHDVLVFPSEWEEPFSLTLLEAMAAGLPVASTLLGGSAEVVRDGENALAFRAGDADDLACHLAWLFTHPDGAAALGRAASEQVLRQYTLDRQVGAIERYMQALRT